jgi:ribosomal protein L7/L12
MRWRLTRTIISLVIFLAGYQPGRLRGRIASDRAASKPDPDSIDEQIKAELRAGRKINVIKLYRQCDGRGLKKAKQAVEALDAGTGSARGVD